MLIVDALRDAADFLKENPTAYQRRLPEYLALAENIMIQDRGAAVHAEMERQDTPLDYVQ
jgi:hypothetical protein